MTECGKGGKKFRFLSDILFEWPLIALREIYYKLAKYRKRDLNCCIKYNSINISPNKNHLPLWVTKNSSVSTKAYNT